MKNTLVIIIIAFGLVSCGGGSQKSTSEGEATTPAEPEETTSAEPIVDLSNKGIGPVTELTLGEINLEMVNEGEQLFKTYCLACHKADEDFIGPAPKDILDRRSPEWVMNMILNPMEMTQKDPIAKRLLEEANNVPMVGQGITEDQARKLLEYFRSL